MVHMLLVINRNLAGRSIHRKSKEKMLFQNLLKDLLAQLTIILLMKMQTEHMMIRKILPKVVHVKAQLKESNTVKLWLHALSVLVSSSHT